MFKGIVQAGQQQARGLFSLKTANLTIDNTVQDGVYTAQATLRKHAYQALCFIGKPYLLPDQPRRLEIHLFNYHGQDFYKQEISLELLQKLRDVKVFKTDQEAQDQVDQDVKMAKQYFSL